MFYLWDASCGWSGARRFFFLHGHWQEKNACFGNNPLYLWWQDPQRVGTPPSTLQSNHLTPWTSLQKIYSFTKHQKTECCLKAWFIQGTAFLKAFTQLSVPLQEICDLWIKEQTLDTDNSFVWLVCPRGKGTLLAAVVHLSPTCLSVPYTCARSSHRLE